MNLFPYQETGASWLANQQQALLADEMGLGKSAQVVRAFDTAKLSTALIVCPASLRINWAREFQRFSPFDHEVTVIETGKDKIGPGINVVSYDLLAVNEDLRRDLKKRAWDVVVMDEAHYCKERSANRTKALYGHGQHPGITGKAKHVWRLTGTPAPNNASELFTHLKNAGLWKQSYWDFVFKFCAGFDTDYGYKIIGSKNTSELKALLAQFMLRRKKDDVLKDLPDIVFQSVTVPRTDVDLDPWFLENVVFAGGVQPFLADMKHLDTTLKTALDTLNNRKNGHYHHGDNLKLLESFASTTATLRRYVGMAKLPKILDIIEEELKEKRIDKVVLFAIHKDVIQNAVARLKKFHPVSVYGATPAPKRQKHVDRFQNDPSCKVFVGQIQAAGTGITLTSACHIAFIEQDWVPANNAQAAMRCHRIGQTRKVFVRFFNLAGSVDELVSETLLHKTREIAKFID